MTFIFELIWPENLGNPAPGVVHYPERNELVLLAVRFHDGFECSPMVVDEFAKALQLKRPLLHNVPLSRESKNLIAPNEEGYVIQFYPSNFHVKIKSEQYMMLHKMRDKITYKGICEILKAGESKNYLKLLPKHLNKMADDIVAALNQKYFEFLYKTKDIYEKTVVLPTRKEQALYLMANCDKHLQHHVFRMLDGRFYDKEI
jgi:hypothetical protein